MTINYGLATQNSPDIKKSEYKSFVSLPKFGFKGKQNNLSPLSKDTLRSNIAFKGHFNKELNEILKTSKQLEIVRNSDYKDLRWFSNLFNSQSEKRVLNLFGVPIEELNTIIDNRLQELLPAERIKNAKLIQNIKIGETQVIKRGLNTPVNTVFTQQGNDYDAFVGDVNIGEVTLAPESNSIFVSNMLSADRKNYKGLGTKLHQLAVEKSFEDGYGGKVTLDAADPGAKLFHYKSGFRKEGAGSEEFSQQMEDVISGKKDLSSIERSVVSMYLPQNQIQRIVDTEIKKSPIILDKNFKFILSNDPEKIKQSQQIVKPQILSGKDLRDMIKTSEKLQSIRTGSAEYLKDLLTSLYTENEYVITNKFGININDLHYLINCRLNEIALKNK